MGVRASRFGVLIRSRLRGTAGLIGIGLAVFAGLGSLAGCGAPEPEFRPNLVFFRGQFEFPEPGEEQEEPGEDEVRIASNADLHQPAVRQYLQDVQTVLVAMFGTPDRPAVPRLPDADLTKILSPERLQEAAGPVGSDETGRPRGLYRQHCVHCHGITGDGRGPTAAFLNPYPRDYRKGLFKFKSTPTTLPPTREDLHRILREGIAGTSMPSFKVLPERDRESLVQYVMYLAIRGQVERALLMEAPEILGSGRLFDVSLAKKDPGAAAEQVEMILGLASETVALWLEADAQQTAVPPPPANWGTPESIAEGKRLFYTPLASCAKCHGDGALGDGQTTDYDEWTKEIRPNVPHALEQFLALGALPPRNILPRNLRQGVYRGGRRPVDLYWRIKNGIAGTPMPAAAQELTSDQIWHLVAYVRSLPYEALSRPKRPDHRPAVARKRL